MIELVIVLAVFLLLTATMDWKSGMLIMLATGFAQDVARKQIEGEPILATAAVAVFFAAVVIGALSRGVPLSLRPVYRWYPEFRFPLTAFIVLAIVQIGVAFTKTGSAYIVGIGMINYLAPFVGLLVAFFFGLEKRSVVRFLSVYVGLAAVMSAGVYLEVWGLDWNSLGSVGTGIYVYPTTGGALKLPSGFYRAAENAAWHSAAAVVLMIVLIVSRNWRAGNWTAILLGLLFFGAILYSGRRKALVEIVMFVLMYGAILSYFHRGLKRLAMLLFLIGLAAMFMHALVLPEAGQAALKPYLSRPTSIFDEAVERLWNMTVVTMEWVVRHNGFFGSGAGVGGQGSQYFGGGVATVGGAAEGGLGRLAAELGVPGLLFALWMGWIFMLSAWRAILWSAATPGHDAAITGGFAAFILSNMVVFLTAGQIFGDPFVVVLLGVCTGFLLSAPLMLTNESAMSSAMPREAHPVLPVTT